MCSLDLLLISMPGGSNLWFSPLGKMKLFGLRFFLCVETTNQYLFWCMFTKKTRRKRNFSNARKNHVCFCFCSAFVLVSCHKTPNVFSNFGSNPKNQFQHHPHRDIQTFPRGDKETFFSKRPTRWAPSSYEWSYNSTSRDYNASYPFIMPFKAAP